MSRIAHHHRKVLFLGNPDWNSMTKDEKIVNDLYSMNDLFQLCIIYKKYTFSLL